MPELCWISPLIRFRALMLYRGLIARRLRRCLAYDELVPGKRGE